MSSRCVVIGGGLAGLACANRILEHGGQVLVLEQGAEPDYPCNSRFSGGIVHVAFKDLRAAPAVLEGAVLAQVGSDEATSQALALARHSPVALEWLRAQGTKFVKGGALEFMRWILAPPRPRRPGLEWKGRGPDVLLRNLSARLREGGGVLRRGVRARELVRRAGRVVGVVAETVDGVETLDADAVVVADGGFQGDLELVAEHICARPETLFQRGAGTGRGDGLRMAMAVGARTVGMSWFYGHLLGRDVFENDQLWPYPTVDAIASVSLLVDGAGRRFADEGRGGVYLANRLARQEDPGAGVVIFDEGVWTGIAADNRYPPCMNPAFVRAGGEVIEARTWAGLAETLSMQASDLEATVTAHNARAQGSDAPSSEDEPPRTGTVAPLMRPPYRAIRVCAGMTYTMGGIAIDEDARVLAADGGCIPGLYAIGSAAGGMEGGERAAYLGGLIKAVVTGLQAADAIHRG